MRLSPQESTALGPIFILICGQGKAEGERCLQEHRVSKGLIHIFSDGTMGSWHVPEFSSQGLDYGEADKVLTLCRKQGGAKECSNQERYFNATFLKKSKLM